MYTVSTLIKKLFKKNLKQQNEYKLSDKTNININKYNNVKTSIERDQRSKISNEEIVPNDFDLKLNIKSDYFCSGALEQLKNKNALVNLFVQKMENLSYSPGINGKIYGFLNDTTQINDSAANILNSLQSKSAMISEVFLVCAAAMATDQTNNLSSVYGMIDPMIFSYENVISSNFQLMDAWYKERLYNFSGLEYTKSKWSFSEQLKIHDVVYGCDDQIRLMKYHEEIIQKKVWENGLSNHKFLDTDKISPILNKIAEIHGGNYFPDITAKDSYASQSRDCLYSSQSEVIPSSSNK
jgi:hypothetical protein